MVFGVFLYFIVLASSIKENELRNQHEQAFSNIFHKEALQIYVENCLDDTMTKGILLLGRQGRIWASQGGLTNFAEGSNGDTFNGMNISYGIRYSTDPNYPNKYLIFEGECSGTDCI